MTALPRVVVRTEQKGPQEGRPKQAAAAIPVPKHASPGELEIPVTPGWASGWNALVFLALEPQVRSSHPGAAGRRACGEAGRKCRNYNR